MTDQGQDGRKKGGQNGRKKGGQNGGKKGGKTKKGPGPPLCRAFSPFLPSPVQYLLQRFSEY